MRGIRAILGILVRVVQEDVVLPDGVEGAGRQCEGGRDGGGEERIVEIRQAATRFGQGK